MYKSEAKSMVKELRTIVEGLPDAKLRKVLTYATLIKQESLLPSEPLSAEEIFALAEKRARQLRKQPRAIAEAQYQALLDALEDEVRAKGIQAEDFPNGD